MPLTRAGRIALAALILLSAALRLLFIDRGALAHDEPFTVYWAQRPLADLWRMLGSENNPPLHFLLVRGWSTLAPFEAAWLRVPSALASALAVWPLFLIAHRLSGLRAAVTAGLLIVFSNYQFGFAQEVRGYALLILLASWSTWLLVRMDRTRRRSAIPLALVNACMVYTHFFGWIMIAVQGAAVASVPALRGARSTFLRAAAITAALFSPYAVIFIVRARTSIAEGTWLPPPAWEELYNMVWRWSNAPVLAVGFLLLIAIAGMRAKNTPPLQRLSLIWTLLPLLGMFSASFWVPIFHDRYLAFAAPGFALLVAASIEALSGDHRARTAVSAIAAAGMALTFAPGRQNRYAPEGVAAMAREWCRDECSLQVAPSWYWLNYLAADNIEELRHDQSHLLRSGAFVPSAAQAAALGPTVLVDATGDGSAAAVKSALRASYAQSDSVEADHRVWVYRFSRAAATVRH